MENQRRTGKSHYLGRPGDPPPRRGNGAVYRVGFARGWEWEERGRRRGFIFDPWKAPRSRLRCHQDRRLPIERLILRLAKSYPENGWNLAGPDSPRQPALD
ncbi:hypothetical protein GW17_00032901 [Ensete ventricosum]|nr:hypothetical protein GW17_00032901 [Ensete ventricosum]